ncbi:MAG: YlxR family protein [Gaiellaceae bacterium]|jgi:predicted RNA-binding protein YlxR (DUF448 family)
MAVAIRTCAGCGRKAPKKDLLRFTVATGRLSAGPKSQGRGAYTCRRLSCFERALTTRAFNRTLRTSVRVDTALRDLYTDADG